MDLYKIGILMTIGAVVFCLLFLGDYSSAASLDEMLNKPLETKASLVWFVFAVVIYLTKNKNPWWVVQFSSAVVCSQIWTAALYIN